MRRLGSPRGPNPARPSRPNHGSERPLSGSFFSTPQLPELLAGRRNLQAMGLAAKPSRRLSSFPSCSIFRFSNSTIFPQSKQMMWL